MAWYWRRTYQRKHISPAEKIISVMILAGLAVIAVAVYQRGQNYDPALFSAHPFEHEAPATTGNTVILGDQINAGGWQPTGPVEEFTADTMYEKIDGKADAYLAYGAQGLQCRTWSPSTTATNFVEAYVFDMGQPVQAFGMYASARLESASPMALGCEGYDNQGSLFFWDGPYYVEISVADQQAETLAAAQALAQSIAAAIPDDTKGMAVFDALPKDHRVTGSLGYFPENAYGYKFLSQIIAARYDTPDGVFSVFVTQATQPAAAQAILAEYENMLAKDGRIIDTTQTDSLKIITGDVFGFIDVVFAGGNWFGGVREVSDATAAQAFVRAWAARLITPASMAAEVDQP